MDESISVECADPDAVAAALSRLCSLTGHFCYAPTSTAEALTSLAWAETLQYVEAECARDPHCASAVLKCFAEALRLALECNPGYVFVVNVRHVLSGLLSLAARAELSPGRVPLPQQGVLR